MQYFFDHSEKNKAYCIDFIPDIHCGAGSEDGLVRLDVEDSKEQIQILFPIRPQEIIIWQ